MARLAGAGIVPFGRGLDPEEMIREAVQAALADAAVDRQELDLVVVANAAAEGFCGFANVAVFSLEAAGLVPTPAVRVETGPSSGLAGLTAANALVDSGHADRVLLLGWEAMTSVPTEQATRLLARYMSKAERRAGLSLPGLVAMLTSAYQARWDRSEEDLARIPVKAHALAASNPIAQFQQEITVEDVLASRLIAHPLRLFHCAPLTDGAAAVVLDREGPVEITGLGHATDHLGYAQRRSPPERFQATGQAAQAAYHQAGIGPEDVDVVEVHDAFSVLEAVNLEDLGLAPVGQGLQTALAGGDPLDGALVVNPSGGLKARGHPVGATGVAQVVELYDQLVSRAANQAQTPSTALVHSIGGFGNNVHVGILEVAP